MSSGWPRRARDRQRITDAAIAFALISLAFPGGVLAVDGNRVPDRLPYFLLAGLACVAIMWHRGHPRGATAVTIACTGAVTALGFVPTPLLLAPAMTALFLLAVRTNSRTAYAATAITIALVTGTALAFGATNESFDLKFSGPALWLLLPATAGGAVRLRLALVEAATARAEYAERTREEEAMRRVAGERMRIARELHDVTAHHLALANAQAGTVAYLIDSDPDRARAMSKDLNSTIAAALEDLGATVGLLRQAGDTDSPLEPAPGLEQLPDLAASFAAAGLKVEVTADGTARPLPPATDLTAYRVVQEALTNVTKHSGAACASVRLTYSPDRLRISITDDDGPAQPAHNRTAGSGYGLIGMHERAHSLGGHLHAAARPDGGFEVTADLPLHAEHGEHTEHVDRRETT